MEKYNIYIGLKKKDMATDLNKENVLNWVSDKFLNIGISGFNVSEIVGFWEGKQEKRLLISFINTFNIDLKTELKPIIQILKHELDQDSILLEKVNNVGVDFI